MGEDTVAHVFDEGLRALCVEHAVAILEYRRKHREDDEQQRNIIEMVTEIFKPAERVYNGECPFRQLRRLVAEHTVDGYTYNFRAERIEQGKKQSRDYTCDKEADRPAHETEGHFHFSPLFRSFLIFCLV